MNLQSLFLSLRDNMDLPLSVRTPDGKLIPAHFHVTEVGVVAKNTKDCGGGQSSSASAYMQLWVANDFDHRLTAGRLLEIYMNAMNILVDTLDVVVEYQAGTICLYGLEYVAVDGGAVILQLSNLHTACAAPDKCGVEESCCGGGCC